ncbi:MAG: hypothetical protein WD267_12595 [Balneolales bacterium]
MDILKELEREIESCENTQNNDIIMQNRINILKSILKIKKDNDKGIAYKKMLYLLIVKLCIVLIDLQHDEVITLDVADMDNIANNLGNPDITVDQLIDLVYYLLETRFGDIYNILILRDDFIGLIYERLVLEKL